MREIQPDPGKAQTLAAGLRVVLAPNPSPMTAHGTNTFIVATGEGVGLTVIDPGPDNAAHLAAILAAIGGAPVAEILVTHPHLDHSPLAPRLGSAVGAPVLAFGGPEAGRSPRMAALAADGALAGGEGVDRGFRPDRVIGDGEKLASGLVAHHMPGHFSSHLCFQWGDTVFSGDHVMGWASSLVSPPDGDMGAYMTSLERIRRLGARRLFPAHGDPVGDPAARIDELAHHRRARETAIIAALTDGPATASALAARIYTDTPAALMPAAARNVFAHLVDLTDRARAAPEGPLAFTARFRSR